MAVPWYPRSWAALIAALTLLLVTGCAGGDEPPPTVESSSAAPGPPSGTPAPPTSATGGDGTGGDGGKSVERDIDAAVSVTNTYWQTHWPQLFTGGYNPPRLLGAYDGGTPGSPVCGSEPLPDDNAVYCPDGDYIAWDMDLMRWGHARGDAWVYLVIAHEWGHAVQNRLDAGLVDLARELQADCLAGAVLFGAAQDGTLTFEEGDTEELADALTALADRTPWTDIADHGDASQRVSYFSRGARSGVKSCLPNAIE
ncbi:neutral zinc metallopeptidase [Streptomyces sp. DR7-3]|uniref:neutral zinc metallopeptidase n=1 Tax=Streptomyces malaysiensis TaxID=92644 RepID=UPI002043E846|nr:neutral zinc metallopeptidase [Streptomyces sp. DR7-3]MCM3807120.1 neutral zinc metallopeptidase [Streptomyces sp. DR7-3]